MSGGEQQMLAFGRALMGAPRLLLMDEPSMGLAPLFVEEIFAAIADLRREGVTILLVEQNASAALDVADYAYVLETGRIVLQGRAAALADDPAVAARISEDTDRSYERAIVMLVLQCCRKSTHGPCIRMLMGGPCGLPVDRSSR